MTIKEVEKRVGITSANIRFYEKEGLLEPKRNKENNYREYTEEQVELLCKIKFLRMLGIAIADIRQLIKSEEELCDVIEKRRAELKKEEENLKEIDNICKYIMEERMNFESMHSYDLEKEIMTLSDRLDYIIHGDVTKEMLSKEKMNRHILGMLLWAFFLNAGIVFWMADFMMGGRSGLMKMAWPVVISCIFCALAVAWISKPGIQMLVFQIASFALIPILLYVVKFIMQNFQPHLGEELIRYETYDNYEGISMESIALIRNTCVIFFLLLAMATVILWILSQQKIFESFWKTETVMMVYGAIAALVVNYVTGLHYLLAFLLTVVCLVYISAVWVRANQGDSTINKYYVITTVTGMLNFPARMLSYQNIGMEKGYGRQEMWKE